MVTIKCIMCKTPYYLNATEAQIEAWKGGTLIQTALPNVPPPLREMLISGICPVCWDSLFSDAEKEE